MNTFSLNSYRSLMNTDGKWWIPGDETFYNGLSFFANVLPIGNKWLYQVVDLALQIFMSNDIFDTTVGTVFSSALTLYDSLWESLGVLLFVVAVFIIFLIFIFTNPVDALKKLVILFAVIGLNGVIYSQGEQYIKDVNTLADEVEAVVVKSITLPMYGVDGEEIENSTNVPSNGEEVSSTDVIRDVYFQMTMKQSFAMINFGTAQYKDEYDDFLYTEDESLGEKGEERRAEIEKLVSEASDDNYYLTPDAVLDKVVIGAYSLINNIFVGGVLIVLAIMKFILKLVILGMIFILPIVSMMSIIPQFGNSLFSGLGKILSVFFLSIFMTAGLFVFYFIMTLIDSAVIGIAGGTASIISCILSLVVKAFVIFLIWKGRRQILSFVTGGRVTYARMPKMPKIPKQKNKQYELVLPEGLIIPNGEDTENPDGLNPDSYSDFRGNLGFSEFDDSVDSRDFVDEESVSGSRSSHMREVFNSLDDEQSTDPVETDETTEEKEGLRSVSELPEHVDFPDSDFVEDAENLMYDSELTDFEVDSVEIPEYDGELDNVELDSLDVPEYDGELEQLESEPVETPEYDGELEQLESEPVETPEYDDELEQLESEPIEMPEYEGEVQKLETESINVPDYGETVELVTRSEVEHLEATQEGVLIHTWNESPSDGGVE